MFQRWLILPSPNQASISPGPTKISTCNPHGLSDKLEHIMTRDIYVTALQETDIPEYAVQRLRKQAQDNGYTLDCAESTNISRDGLSRYGRRAAILTKLPGVPHDISDYANSNCAYLLASGRWLGRLIPTGNGRHHMIVASLYGISQASVDSYTTKQNEALLVAAVVRMDHIRDVPSFLCSDLNDDPARSEVSCNAIDNEIRRANGPGRVRSLVSSFFPFLSK